MIECDFSQFIRWIRLIPQNEQLNIGTGIFLDLNKMDRYFLEPELFDIFKALFFGYVINKNDGMSPFIIGSCDSPKSLLASCIPDLELYILAIYNCCFESEIHTNCGKVMLLELILCKSY